MKKKLEVLRQALLPEMKPVDVHVLPEAIIHAAVFPFLLGMPLWMFLGTKSLVLGITGAVLWAPVLRLYDDWARKLGRQLWA